MNGNPSNSSNSYKYLFRMLSGKDFKGTVRKQLGYKLNHIEEDLPPMLSRDNLTRGQKIYDVDFQTEGGLSEMTLIRTYPYETYVGGDGGIYTREVEEGAPCVGFMVVVNEGIDVDLECFPDELYGDRHEALLAAQKQVREHVEATKKLIANWDKNLNTVIRLELRIGTELNSCEK